MDLSSNYSSLALSEPSNNTNTDAIPTGSNSHGTSCACIIGAKGNNNSESGIGKETVGVAPNCNIIGINLLDHLSGDVANDIIEAEALSRAPKTSIYNNSWGPQDVGYILGAPGPPDRQHYKMDV